MRILIIRHGEPYYPTDSLTEKGQREAELLSRRLVKENIDYIYVSPMGRAKLTAKPTLEKLKMEATELEWLEEFRYCFNKGYSTKYTDNDRCPWNMPPEMWTGIPGIYDRDGWKDAEIYKGTKIVAEYDRICGEFDKLIAKHGYVWENGYYKVKPGFEQSTQTIALFCHMGLGLTLVSHLLGAPFTTVTQTLFMPTSSVTTIFMEKHFADNKTANARVFQIGDTSHLYAEGEPLSPSGLHSDTIY